MGKSKAPKPPNFKPLAAAARAAADQSYALGQEQLAWAKEQYARDSAITGRVVDQFLADQAENSANARADRERYERIFQPLEEDLAREAQDYASPERRSMEMGRAQAAVAQQYQGARQAAQSELESYGINPSATRFAALDIGMRANEAAAKAAAGNQAGLAVDDRARALRSEAINVGRGYPGQIATQYGTAQGAGSGAAGTQLNQTQSGANTMGTGLQWQGAGNQALNIWGNVLNSGYQNKLAQYQANQQSSSGIGGLIGGALGLALGFDEGGPVPEASQGGGVPISASPTGGRAIDDVSARLTPGEFVVPKDIVSWKGEEFFQKLIKQSREAKSDGANAQASRRAALPVPPTFQSQAIAA